MATLLSQAQALVAFANGVTGKTDKTLGDAVKSLADNYGGTSGSVSFPELTDYTLLSSQVKALTAYCNSIDGESDTKLGDAMRHLAEGGSTPQWMKDAAETYGLPLTTIKAAYAKNNDIRGFLDSTQSSVGYCYGNGSTYIDTGCILNIGDRIIVGFRNDNSSVGILWGYRFSGTYANTSQAYIADNNTNSTIIVGIDANHAPVYAKNVNHCLIIDTSVKLDGAVVSNTQIDNIYSNGTSVYCPYLFALNAIGNVISICDSYKGISFYSVVRDGATVACIIPIQDGSMYDVVNGRVLASGFNYSLK